MNNKRNLCFIDTETTGLDADKGEIIELAAILTTPDNSKVLKTLEVKFRMEFPERAEKKALEVNGYNDIEWAVEKCASDKAAVAVDLLHMTDDAILIGHNVSFDERFVDVFLRRLAYKPNWHYHKIDTVVLAWPLVIAGRAKWLRLGDVCEALGIKQDGAHRAMTDALTCRAIYTALIRQYGAALNVTMAVAEAS
jgi:DNA polymerase III alpha subunit (gram-positive type)